MALADLHETFTGPPDGGTCQAHSVLTMVRGLTKRYGDVLAADGATFDVPAGKVTRYPGWAPRRSHAGRGRRLLRSDANS